MYEITSIFNEIQFKRLIADHLNNVCVTSLWLDAKRKRLNRVNQSSIVFNDK